MTKFVKGVPCKLGHTLKYKANNSCVECCRARDAIKEVDHWSLTYTKVIVPDVTGIFWDAIN